MSSKPYDDIKILDLTFWLGRYATRLFADLGADVIRIEPPEGLPDRTLAEKSPYEEAAFQFFNANKSSFVLDPSTQSGQGEFERLASEASVVFLERNAPFFGEIARLHMLNPRLVIVAISPYGLGGPREAQVATDLTLQAAGGIAWLSGRPGEPPLRLPFEQSAFVTSVYAAVAAAASLFDSDRGGLGHIIDVSAQECIAHSLQNAIQVYDLEDRVSVRGGENTRDAGEDVFACMDGYVFLAIAPMYVTMWKAFVRWMTEEGHPSGLELSLERWSDVRWRQTDVAKRIFRQAFEAFIRDKTREELRREAIDRRLILAPVATILDVISNEHLAFSSFFHDLPGAIPTKAVKFPGAPYRLSGIPWSVDPAPKLGAAAGAA